MHIYDKHGNTLRSLSAGEDVIIFKKGIIAPKAEHTFGNPNVILGGILAATDTSALFMQSGASAPTHRIPVGNANTKARTLFYPSLTRNDLTVLKVSRLAVRTTDTVTLWKLTTG